MRNKEYRTCHFFLCLLLKCLDFKTIHLCITFATKNLEEYFRFRESKVRQLMDYNWIFFRMVLVAHANILPEREIYAMHILTERNLCIAYFNNTNGS